ncbi:GNAT family N-acetyltransferase [Galbibacter sp. EGI 63066]|uniref:GNAT family N-acetyltransferase n=1 Tax=Galbibacter sp. EGI 63066 TaxID=2993559 RepID=UPI002248D699|nr:GNAT family N-acetyltransferase [Galbibacter sp. EGI 63066]MCX2681429.1 GNAT family N-acetyltransferase [Galbibacter sp. EGI 63066]
MIEIKQVTTKKQLQQFVKFPFRLYKNSENWVPPIIKEELANFDEDKNPAYKDADAYFFLAYKDNKIAGRVCAIINWNEVKNQGKSKLRFGWFDAIDDVDVTKALFDKVFEIGKQNRLEYVEGPAGFSNMDKAGMLIEGFDRIGSMPTNYNYPYYPKHIEQVGFKKEVDWKEFEIMVPLEVPEKLVKFSNLLTKKFKLKVIDLPNTKALLPYAKDIFDLMNRSYKHLESFTPIKPYQVEHYKDKYLKFLDPDFVNLIADENGELVGFSVIMPSFSKALQKAKGKLFPFGFYHLLKAQKKNAKATLLLIGVAPEYMRKGLTAIIFHKCYEVFVKRGITTLETNPELETNNQVQALWKDYNPQLIKKWRTYRKEL